LHYCAIHNHIESCKLLLNANINTELINQNGLSAFEIANRLYHFECAKQIKQMVNGEKLDRIEWIGLFEDENQNDLNQDHFRSKSISGFAPRDLSLENTKANLNVNRTDSFSQAPTHQRIQSATIHLERTPVVQRENFRKSSANLEAR